MKITLSFYVQSNSYGLYWWPCDEVTKGLLKKGRKTFRGDDLIDFVNRGYQVRIDISQNLGHSHFVEIKNLPSNS